MFGVVLQHTYLLKRAARDVLTARVNHHLRCIDALNSMALDSYCARHRLTSAAASIDHFSTRRKGPDGFLKESMKSSVMSKRILAHNAKLMAEVRGWIERH